MGRLNSLIKFIVFNANALLFLGGLGTIVVASLVLEADFIKLAEVCVCASRLNSAWVATMGDKVNSRG